MFKSYKLQLLIPASGKYRGSTFTNMKSSQQIPVDSSSLHAESHNNRRGVPQRRLIPVNTWSKKLPSSFTSHPIPSIHHSLPNALSGQKPQGHQATLPHDGSYSSSDTHLSAQNPKPKRGTLPRMGSHSTTGAHFSKQQDGHAQGNSTCDGSNLVQLLSPASINPIVFRNSVKRMMIAISSILNHFTNDFNTSVAQTMIIHCKTIINNLNLILGVEKKNNYNPNTYVLF